MSESHQARNYKRRVTPPERLFSRSPFSTVTVVARIAGEVSESMLRDAVTKVQQRHLHLRVRIAEDADGEPWFTTEGAGEIPIEAVPRESDDHWVRVVQESCQIPFEFDAQPAVRFVLVRSPSTSELIILCHHIICDGLSLAYLARDLMHHLGDPARQVQVLPDPVPIDRDNIPPEVSLNPIARFLINRINKKWQGDQVVFDQEDYKSLNSAYWMHYTHQMLPIELSETQTQALVDRCRRQEVTVNSALSAAFAGAQTVVQSQKRYHPTIVVAADLRGRLPSPAGEVMGFYAGGITLQYKYDSKRAFWENARRFHRQVRPLFTDKNLFQELLTWCHLDPTILEALNFKKLGGLVPAHFPRYQKLSAFAARDDTVQSVLKREKMESLDRIAMGTAVTNLTKLDFPTRYGTLELDRLIMKPGGGFPLANINLVLGAVTCAGRLSLVVEYVESNIEPRSMEKIRDTALGFLLSE